MSYIVFIDTARGTVKHTSGTSYTETKQQVKDLRDAGHRAWWEFKPDHPGFGAGQALAQPHLCEV
ncbi:MAG: hypothetical protein KKA05_02255 [Alphaproteobacteria bacterium]|nr:hypothetical protein [Alphaproteobacteria bacterium]